MHFSFSFPLAAIVCFALAAAGIIIISVLSWRMQWRVRRIFRRAVAADEAAHLPRASVIIFTRDEPEALGRNLPKLLKQDYPAGFEVIVVNDGASADTNMVVGALKAKYDNIYLTFTPDGVRNLSRKKLALTIGAKAAKGEVVVITDASAEVPSEKWLATLLQGFADASTGVVIGYGAPDAAYAQPTAAFDYAADSAAWLDAAARGHAYRACPYNVAYRRSLFFDNKGFANSINMRNGDDDVFISQISTPDNCRVEVAPDAIMGHEIYSFKRQMHDSRISHAFTGRKLWKGSRRAMACAQWMMWAVAALAVAGALAMGAANLAGWIVAAVLLLCMLVGEAWSWALTARWLRMPVKAALAPLQAMARPLRNALVSIKSRSERAANFSWQ